MTPDLPGSVPAGRRVRLRLQRRRAPRVPVAVNPKPPGVPVQHAAATIGAMMGLVGLLGFLPGLTANFDDLQLATYSSATLFGLFSVSVLHNAILLLVGVAGLALAGTPRTARAFLLAGGGLLALLAALGHGVAADGWLRLVVGVIMVCLAFLPGRSR